MRRDRDRNEKRQMKEEKIEKCKSVTAVIFCGPSIRNSKLRNHFSVKIVTYRNCFGINQH